MENLENNNQINKTSVPVNPSFNVVTPSGLQERMTGQIPKASHSKKRMVFIILAVVLFVLIGLGGWWYYAQGETLRLLKQAKWDWGSENMENFQQNFDFSLELNTVNKQEDPENAYAMLFGGGKFKLDMAAGTKNIGLNLESDTKLKITTEGFDINLGFKIKKIEDKFYIALDIKDLGDLVGAFVSIPDFEDTWIEIDIKDIDSYTGTGTSYDYNSLQLDKDQIAKINIKINEFFDSLREDKIFKITDLKKDENGFRKIQLNVKEDKIDDLILTFINYTIDIAKISGLEANQQIEDMNQQDLRQKWTESFEKMKAEKPEDFAKIKKIFDSIDFIVLVNPDSKIIQGIELYINDMTIDSEDSSISINGNVKQLIKKIDYYDINKPEKTQTIEDIRNFYQQPEENLIYTNNVDTDGDGLTDEMEARYGTIINNPDSDGDGYSDGEEVNGGYNPMGEGKLYDPNKNNIGSNIVVTGLSNGDWVRGDKNAKITIVEFSDLDCPFCQRFHDTMKQVIIDYDGDVNWVYRHFPLTTLHPDAFKKAEAAECVGEQGGNDVFWAFIDKIFEGNETLLNIDDVAVSVGVDKDKFNACLDSGKYKDKIESNTEDAGKAGGRGTPYSMIIFGDQKVAIPGALPYESVKYSIDNLLK